MKKYAVVFPGQGAQSVGMGKSFYETDPIARQIYDEASDILSQDIASLCFQDNDFINQTKYAQKAIIVTEIAMYESFKHRFQHAPDALCGFSLGEYAALYASGIFDLKTILALLDKRSQWMDEACETHPGGMVAILGGDLDKIKQFCDVTTNNIGLLAIANDNTVQQKVLSGTNSALSELLNHANELGIKRTVTLSVSGPFHTVLMHEAAVKMSGLVNLTEHSQGNIPVVMNASAAYLKIDALPLLMEKQMESPVRFLESIEFLISEGINTFIEIGPGKVLTGLIKKINQEVQCVSINEIDDFTKWEEL